MNYKSTIRQIENNPDKKVIITLKDLALSFKNSSNLEENQIIYKVFIKRFSPINLGLTVINSGTINKEFYMTRGHIHTKETPEFYILLEGKGILLIQKDRSKSIKLRKGEIFLIPEAYSHRLINIGNKKLKVLTIYYENAKPNYNIKFKKRFFKNSKYPNNFYT